MKFEEPRSPLPFWRYAALNWGSPDRQHTRSTCSFTPRVRQQSIGRHLTLALVWLILIAIGRETVATDTNFPQFSRSVPTGSAERPNVLWITSEDNGPQLGCYGDTFATTPNLDQLAARGQRYLHCWSNAPVCAPARTAIVTGLYPTTLGAQHMRSEVAVPPEVKLYPELLRAAGYYCCNRSKEDYNLIYGKGLWDDSSGRAHWRHRSGDQPFFAVFNITTTHESQLRTRPHAAVADPGQVPLPPFHPDRPEIRQDWAQYYDKIAIMDRQVGQILQELEQDGLADDTIIFYYGDHGTGMPRGKRWLYETGLHVPLIVYVPERWRTWAGDAYRPAATSDRLVSFVDLVPTILSLLRLPANTMSAGQAFLGDSEASPREYLFGFRDRMDERTDMSRAVRDRRFSYIRNYYPRHPQGQFLDYMFQTPTTRVWRDAFVAGECNEAQSSFWKRKPAEELYDLSVDPHQVNNLASDPRYASELTRMQTALKRHVLQTRDLGFWPESEMLARAGSQSPMEIGRDENRYPLQRLWDVADFTTRSAPRSRNAFMALLDDSEAGVRYWGVQGIIQHAIETNEPFDRQSLKVLEGLAVEDPSPAVRIAAAEACANVPRLEPMAEWGVQARARALELLVIEATRSDNSFAASIEALQAVVHSEPTAEELHPHWPKLNQLQRRGPNRRNDYWFDLLAVLPRRMNVLVLVADDQRWDSVGIAGNPNIVTPHLDGLARQGVHFTQARVTTSICMTSRASILTGQYMARHGIDRFGVALSPEAFAETYVGRLRTAGYWTGFVGKYGVGAPRAGDFDFLRAYEGRHWLKRQGEEVHVTELNRRDSLEFLNSRPVDRPFLLSVSFFAPHAEDGHPDQYRPQAWSEEAYKEREIPFSNWTDPRFLAALPPFLSAPENEGRVRFGWRFDSDERHRASMKRYYRLITEVDAAVGDMLQTLAEQQVLENTMIVYIGDNGYFHGDRGLADKWYPYEQALRVPLIVFDPRVPQANRGTRDDRLTLNIDVAPTVLNAAALTPSNRIQGDDLARLYLAGRAAPAWRQDYLYEHPTITRRERIPSSQAVVSLEQKFVQWPEWDYEQFFDLKSDPDELDNRVGSPDWTPRIDAARQRLTELLEAAK